MRFVRHAVLCAGLAFAATPAAADILTVTYTGTVASGTDFTGVFGPAGRSLAGLSYTAVYLFDDSLGTRETVAPSFDSVIGGAFDGTTSPSLGATLTIDGASFSFNGLAQGLEENFPLGGTVTSSASDAPPLDGFDASFVEETLMAAGVPSSLDTPFSATGTASADFFSNAFQIAYAPAGSAIETANASGTLAPTSVVVTVAATAPAVPEPAEWTSLLVGFGVLGGAMRQRRRGPNVVVTPALDR